ncbi:MAG: hypothetical protein MN733_19700, partial [Nitrososphaera sp.]|nr:hypothetical protein [Nitrososphaera sp.]
VRFTVQPEKNRRYVWVVSQVGSNAGFFYPESDNIPFSYAKMSNGIYKITITEQFSAGEYGLVAAGGSTGYLVYSFSISGSH